MYQNVSHIKAENREAKLQFLQYHYQQSLVEANIPNDNLTYDMNLTYHNTGDTIVHVSF